MSKKAFTNQPPIEFRQLAQNKFELAKQISQQRERLKQQYLVKTHLSQTIQKDHATYPRSYTMRYLTSRSVNLPVLASASIAAVVLFLFARRIGYQNLWRFGSTLWVIILPLLEQHDEKKTNSFAQDDEAPESRQTL